MKRIKYKTITSMELIKRINYYTIHLKTTKRTHAQFTYLINQLSNLSSRNFCFDNHYLLFEKVIANKSKKQFNMESMLKLCKVKFFKSIYILLKKALGKNYEGCQLSSKFITNATIKDNKFYMKRTLWDIYKEYGQLDKINSCLNGKMCRWNIKCLILQLLSMTYERAFLHYITSMKYRQDCNSLRYKEGDIKALLFSYVSKIYIRYYNQDIEKDNDLTEKTFISTSNNSL